MSRYDILLTLCRAASPAQRMTAVRWFAGRWAERQEKKWPGQTEVAATVCRCLRRWSEGGQPDLSYILTQVRKHHPDTYDAAYSSARSCLTDVANYQWEEAGGFFGAAHAACEVVWNSTMEGPLARLDGYAELQETMRFLCKLLDNNKGKHHA